MSAERPPTIDPAAAARWADRIHTSSPWLHEEVGRRMAARLQWIKMQPRTWADWSPLRGGIESHIALARRYPKARCYVVEPNLPGALAARRILDQPWWRRSRWLGPAPRFEIPADAAVQMVWANMALHMDADPQARMTQWHAALEPDGFLMFSCLGPDTLRALRGQYHTLGWPPPAHEFTDMHDWGDMLVGAGFAEPVMDMEHITLTFETAERALAELRQLGRNLHPQRFPALRGKQWHRQLVQLLSPRQASVPSSQAVAFTFEIIYGHALKPRPRLPVQSETILSLDEMRRVLQRAKTTPSSRP